MGGRETTVLFAGVCDATLDAVAPCLEQLREATRAAGGRVIKTIGEDLMALFPSPDAAASAAAAMQKAIEGMPDGGKIHQLTGVPSAFTPDYAPEEMFEIASKLYKASR